MDHDLLWLLHAFKTQILDLDEFCVLRDAWFPVKPERAQPTAEQAWLDRRTNRHRRRPKRQLHPCRLQKDGRSDRRERSHNRVERLNLVDQMAGRDLVDQIDDYVVNQLTDIPSVGMTVGNVYFRDNIGEYPLVYFDPADDEEDWGVTDDTRVPDWLYYGFNNEAEYEDYLDAYSSLYADDWHDPSYYDEAAQLETA